jgi:hypothetical protein
MATRPNDVPNHASTPDEEAALRGFEGLDETADRDAGTARNREELQAIGAEIDSIKESVAHIAEATTHYVKRRVTENSTDLIAANPVRAALWAAFAGFLVGRLSRW